MLEIIFSINTLELFILQILMAWYFRLLLVLASLGIVGWMATDMLALTAQEQLWGLRPLYLYSAAFVALAVCVQPFLIKGDKSWTPLRYVVLTGLLLSAGFTPMLLFPLMFVGFVPLLLAEDSITPSKGKTAKWQMFKVSFMAMLLWNIITTYWVTNTMFAAGLGAMLANTLLMCIPLVMYHSTKRRIPKLANLAFIAYWTAFEFVHLHWDLSWSWLNLGNSFAEWPQIIQWYEWTGAFGGTIWILLVNVLIADLIRSRNAGDEIKKQALIIAAVVFIPISISLVRYFTYTIEGEEIEVIAVQPNFEPHYVKWNNGMNEAQQIEHYQLLAKPHLNQNTAFIVYPETSINGYSRRYFGGHLGQSRLWNDRLSGHPSILDLQNYLSNYPNTTLITGTSTYGVFPEGSTSPAMRSRKSRQGRTVFYEGYNSAIAITGNGQDSIPVHIKSKLVPGSEKIPFPSLLGFLSLDLGGIAGNVGRGDRREVFFNRNGIGIGPVICYESIYGEYVTEYVKNGAQALAIITNDGWWDNTAGHRQHLAFASLRAIETRRGIARAANSGISAFINQRGDIRQKTQYNSAIAIQDKLILNSSQTLYVRVGDVLARVACLIAILLLLNTVFQKLKKLK